MGKGVKLATSSSVQIEFLYEGIRFRERIKFNPATTEPDVALKRAERHREAILHEIDNGVFDYARVFPKSKNLKKIIVSDEEITVGVWVTLWLDGKNKHLKTSTLHNYKYIAGVINTNFGSKKLAEIKRADVKTWCDSLETCNQTIERHISFFRNALQGACEAEIIAVNVLRNFKYHKIELREEDHADPFNREEQKSILSALHGHQKNLIQFAFWTGMRTSELIALKWTDVNWLKKTIFISRAKTREAKVPETPKTKSGRREVKLLTPAYRALIAQNFLTDGMEFIFINPGTNLPWTGDQPIRQFWTRALKKANVRYRKPYQTRHTYASMMLSSGENLSWVSKQIGHSNVIITAKNYATWIPDSQPDAGESAVTLFT